MMYIFDTNIIINILNNNKEIIELYSSYKDITITSISLGELYYGAEKSINKLKNITIIDTLRENAKVLTIDEISAKYYGKLKTELKAKGKPIPENDLWIGSICLANNAALVTMDKHFSVLADLIQIVQHKS